MNHFPIMLVKITSYIKTIYSNKFEKPPRKKGSRTIYEIVVSVFTGCTFEVNDLHSTLTVI